MKCKRCDGRGVIETRLRSIVTHFTCPICKGSGYENQTMIKGSGKCENNQIPKKAIG